MSEIKILELEDQLQFELNNAGEKLVVVYYSAEWCVPCQKMKLTVEALSKKYPEVVFLKLYVEACPETAITQGITAMPTFAFYRNINKIDVLQGANPIALEQKINQHLEEKYESLYCSDLRSLISMRQCECMNESDEHPFTNVFENDESYVKSDCDAQLIMAVTFQQSVKIHSVTINAPQANGPKDLKIFINLPHTLSFDEAESFTPTQELTLISSQLDGSPIPLFYVKFQNVSNIQIYIKTNQNSMSNTIINHLSFIGIPLATTNMGDFNK